MIIYNEMGYYKSTFCLLT